MDNEKIDDEIIVLGKGLNGSTSYHALTKIKRDEIIPILGLDKFIDKLFEKYPEACRKISRCYESTCIGDLPKEIDFSMLEPFAMAKLIESVSEKIKLV